MTQEEKQLLLKDLCARLPYGVQIHIDFNENGHIIGDATLNTITSITGQIFGFADFKQDFKNGDCFPISGFGSHKILHLEDFKPYLRPMSSMTEDEKKQLENYLAAETISSYKGLFEVLKAQRYTTNFLYSRHLDILCLIEKGLALEAPEGMYK